MKEYLDSIIEFLEKNLGDNYIWIAGGAAALLLIIIIAIAAGSRKRKAAEGDKPRDFFLEGEYDTLIRDEARAKHTAAAVASEPEAADEPAQVIECTAEEQAALKEELQQVQININIERGQVHIGYEEDGRLSCVVEEMIREAEAAAEAPEAEVQMPAETEVPVIEAGHEILADQGIVLEKIELVKASPAKKFGPDNFNTGRSGRVFTEEELREQIKQ